MKRTTTISPLWDQDRWAAVATSRIRPEVVIAAPLDSNTPQDLIDFESYLESGESMPVGIGNEAGGVRLIDGWCYITNNYVADDYARLQPSEMLRLLRWWAAVVDSPDYRNPDAVIEPIEIEYDQDFPDDLHPHYREAMYRAELYLGSDTHFTRGRKLDDGSIYIWEPIEPWGRAMIWNDNDETFLLTKSSTTPDDHIAAWNAGQRTDPDDLDDF